MHRLLFCALLLLSTPALAEFQTVKVVDADGQPVAKFHAMFQFDRGGSVWQDASDGKWSDSFDKYGDVINIAVRADGHATTVQQFEDAALEQLLNNRVEIRLDRGREVTIRLNLPEGMKLPEGFMLDSYFSQFASHVHGLRQPSNRRRNVEVPVSWNMLNAKQISANEYSLRLPTQKSPAEQTEFYLAIHHPGWMQFCELGPFREKDFVNDVLQVGFPRPSSVEVVFDAGGKSADELPFDTPTLMVYWVLDDSGRVYRVIGDDEPIEIGKPFLLTDLGPGRFSFQVRTKPKRKIRNIKGTEINPGKFFIREVVTFKGGEQRQVKLSWAPFDRDAVKGSARARITILNPDGSVPTGKPAEITWWDGHYGQIVAFEGAVPDDGIIVLDGVTGKQPGVSSPYGRYTVTVDNEHLGFFGLEDTNEVQEFEFRITPGAGDVAPDASLVDVETKSTSKLSDHRGKVVYMEFWTIGCGPCQPEMRKLNNLAKKKSDAWRDKVALVSVSCDDDAALVQNHAATRGWSALRHYVGPQPKPESRSLNAQDAFVVHSYPTALLIDQSGKILWRGHPATFKGNALSERIETLLEGKKDAEK